MSRTKAPQQFYTPDRVEDKGAVQPVTLHLPAAHPRQYEFLQMLYKPGIRFAVGACGTKFGKTFGTGTAIIKRAWDVKDSLNWWVAPTFDQSINAFNMCKRLLPEGTYRPYVADRKLVILHPDGTERSSIVFKSGDDPDSLRGFGVHFFVLDEAARCKYESWVSLYTTVTQTAGVGYIISTPKGRNWFYDVYQWGEKVDERGDPIYEAGKSVEEGGDPHPEFLSICMPTWANPHVPLESVRGMKRTLPEDVYRQEVEAKFLLDSAGVFRGVRDCIRGEFEDRVPGQQYVMGVDLARLKDYSVLTVMNRRTRHVVYHERFTQISWEVQYQRIIAAARKYNAVACIDSTGIGDPIVEAIKGSGIQVLPYKISSAAAKQQLIDRLRVGIENHRVSFPNIPALRKELESFEYEVTPSGVVRFSSPSGGHDDCVISLALANWIADTPEFKYTYMQISGV